VSLRLYDNYYCDYFIKKANNKYMLKHCREYFTKNEERGQAPSTLFRKVRARRCFKGFMVLAYSHTLKLVINKRNTNHYSHITT